MSIPLTRLSFSAYQSGIVTQKLRDETDPKRLEAYRLLTTELKELLAVTSGKENCEEAERIHHGESRPCRLKSDWKLPEESLSSARCVWMCSFSMQTSARNLEDLTTR